MSVRGFQVGSKAASRPRRQRPPLLPLLPLSGRQAWGSRAEWAPSWIAPAAGARSQGRWPGPPRAGRPPRAGWSDRARSLPVGAEHHVVEDRLIERHGDVILGLKADRALQILRFHAREVQVPHDHPGVGDTEDDRLAPERVRGLELPDLRRQEIGIRHLSLYYRAGGNLWRPTRLRV